MMPALALPSTEGTSVFGVSLNDPKNEDWTVYQIGKSLNKGGFGSVHLVTPPMKHPLVAKIYTEPMRERIKHNPKIAMRLVALAQHRVAITKDLSFAVWPRRVLFAKKNLNGADDIAANILGFTMLQLIGTTSLFELMMNEEKRLRIQPVDLAHIAILIADQLAKLHRHPWGFVFGDLSPNNIHVTNDYKAVHFIDTDSFQFDFQTGKYAFPMDNLTTGYKSPGAEHAIRNKQRITAVHDDFVLAVLIFQLLMTMNKVPRHPFQCLDKDVDTMIERRIFPFENLAQYPVPAVNVAVYNGWPADIRAAFRRTFTQPDPVTAEEWTQILIAHYRRGLQ
jgi:DNA-binding helix-hairpin-helix protein with protein kinase domain